MDRVGKLRKKLGEKDEEIIRAIAARMMLTDEIGIEKQALGMPVYHPDVERDIIENAVKLGGKRGLSRAAVESVMRTIIAESRLRQEEERAGGRRLGGTGADVTWHLPSPLEFIHAVPRSSKAGKVIENCRKDIKAILDGKDDRVILIVGPCSVHDYDQALEYAEMLCGLKKKVDGRFLLVMRAYAEKSRTGRSWTGFLSDPYLDGTGDVQEGITMVRKLLNGIAEKGVPTAVEFINSMTAQYIGDLASWAAIGARSSGSQMHRDMASGLDMPVGFKNSVHGSAEAAIGAIEYAGQGHTFLGPDENGKITAVRTNGNRYCHPVLRGGEKPNFDARSIGKVQKALKAAGLSPRLVVDCSHGNSGKVAKNQIAVFEDIMRQRAGNPDIIGLMLESNLKAGKQKLPASLEGFDRSKLRHGVSVTDECLGWKETEKLILEAYENF